MSTQTCPVSWPGDELPGGITGTHACKHEAGHQLHRHMCACGSWPGDPAAGNHDSHPEATPSRDGSGDSRREVCAPPPAVHLPVGA